MLQAGSFLADRYEILEKIGTGGMSDVYRAADQVLQREVAVKVLKAEFAQDESFVSKFRSEATNAANLEHPNIVNIYDVGSEDGLYYIIMEYVEGITLKTYIEKKGHLNYKEVISIAIQVGRGIEAAHNNKIIHRDIKPQNIIISKEGKVKVTDFGIARAASSNTVSADVMGSVHYISPEQARNGYITEKSDIYSLGIVMYEMATGRVPFDGDTAVAVALKHIQGEMAAPSELVRDIPVSLERIIEKATMKSPERRYANVGELLVDLKKALVTPNEDFVVISDLSDAGSTKVITQDELDKIRDGAEPDMSDINLDDDAEEDDDDDKLNPKMERAVTIMGIVAAVIIALVVIFLIANVAGFKFGTKKVTQNETKTVEEEGNITVPDVRGLSVEDATKKLEDLGLKIKVKEGTVSSDKYAKDTIVTQSVKKGKKVTEGTVVKVALSSGPSDIENTVTVPNVIGKSEADAKKGVENMGLRASVEYEYSDEVAQGNVISQTPKGNSEVAEGTVVKIIVSQGKKDTSVEVPNIKAGASPEEAKGALEALGLVASFEEVSEGTPGKVVSVSPGPGTKVDPGSKVTVKVGKKDPEIPDIVGKTEGEARSLLEGAGFSIGTVTYVDVTDAAKDGVVLSQKKKETAPAGTPIEFDVGRLVSSEGGEGETP